LDPLGCQAQPDAEPNDVEADAIALGDVTCGLVAEVEGAVDFGDQDWFTYHGIDDGSCNDNTLAIVDAADPQLDVCMFWECDQGNPQVTCQGNAIEATSPDGRIGCCGTGSVIFNNNACLGAAKNDSGTVHIQVQGPTESVCVDYALAYRFF
jgi:hypothetical protein